MKLADVNQLLVVRNTGKVNLNLNKQGDKCKKLQVLVQTSF